MPFDNEFLPVCEVFRKVVRTRIPGRAIRADDIFRPGNVVDQIKEAIQHADFCVADITGNNPNVMWEVGYASALRKPVIAVRQHNEQIPFDVRQERLLNYDLQQLSSFRPKLAKAVESVVADLSSKPQFLGWYYDELTNLKQKLSHCEPSVKGHDLLTILKEAITQSEKSRWTAGDEGRLMDAIANVTGRFERTDSFWWLIVHGVFVYSQVDYFQVQGSEGYRDNLHLVKFSERGVALLNLLSQDAGPHSPDPGEGTSKTNKDEFFDKLTKHKPAESKVAKRILDWAEEHFDSVQWQRSSFVPIYKYSGKSHTTQ